MICRHALPAQLCVMCMSMYAKVIAPQVDIGIANWQKQQTSSYDYEAKRKSEQQERERQEELKREAERQLELKRQEILAKCVNNAENGKFLEAWFHARDSNLRWCDLSSKTKYVVAEAVLLDNQFFNEEIKTISQHDKIKLVICLLEECGGEDKAHHLLRRALCIARGHDGPLLPLSELIGTTSVVSDNNKNFAADAITYRELVLKLPLDEDKINQDSARDFCIVSKEYENLKSNLFKEIDSLALIVKKFPEAKTMQEAITTHQKALDEEQKRQEAERLRQEEADARRQAEEKKRRQAFLKRLAEEKELARREAEKAKQIEADKIDQIIVAAMRGIENYQVLPRTIFNSHLGFFAALFDNSRGTIRANAYYYLLSSERYTHVQKGLSLLALLSNTHGTELKNQVLKCISSNDRRYLEAYVARQYHGTSWQLQGCIYHLMLMANDKPVIEEKLGDHVFNSLYFRG